MSIWRVNTGIAYIGLCYSVLAYQDSEKRFGYCMCSFKHLKSIFQYITEKCY